MLSRIHGKTYISGITLFLFSILLNPTKTLAHQIFIFEQPNYNVYRPRLKVCVRKGPVNIRTEPAIRDGNKITQLAKNHIVIGIGVNYNQTWSRVSTIGIINRRQFQIEGWIKSNLLKPSNKCNL